jgi:hypothetical protein
MNYCAARPAHGDVINCVAKIQVPRKFIEGRLKPGCQPPLPSKAAYLVRSLVSIIRSRV